MVRLDSTNGSSLLVQRVNARLDPFWRCLQGPRAKDARTTRCDRRLVMASDLLSSICTEASVIRGMLTAGLICGRISVLKSNAWRFMRSVSDHSSGGGFYSLLGTCVGLSPEKQSKRTIGAHVGNMLGCPVSIMTGVGCQF